ncbi:MAG: hypothetical protein H8E46_06550 [FCB group bacterium]|nr:hypothetical protein [FCB group bacterium]
MKPEADCCGDSPIALSRVCNTGSEIAVIALIASEFVPALAFAVFRVLRALPFFRGSNLCFCFLISPFLRNPMLSAFICGSNICL